MILRVWPRICGVHINDTGQSAAVWLAWDKEADVLHLYDCHKHEREVLAVQAQTILSRGKWIPVAWCREDKEIIEKLRDHGVNTLPELDIPKDSDEMAETLSLDIWERMRTGRFKVARHLESWLEEYKTFFRDKSRVPRETHPLMSATRHAVALLDYARVENSRITGPIEYPRISIA